jgi:hypothetical protein
VSQACDSHCDCEGGPDSVNCYWVDGKYLCDQPSTCYWIGNTYSCGGPCSGRKEVSPGDVSSVIPRLALEEPDTSDADDISPADLEKVDTVMPPLNRYTFGLVCCYPDYPDGVISSGYWEWCITHFSYYCDDKGKVSVVPPSALVYVWLNS